MIFYKEFQYPKKWKYHIKGKKNPEKVCDNVFCFDIETSSYLIDNGRVYTYPEIEKKFSRIKDKRNRYERTLEFCQNCQKGNVCYLWQFSVDDVVMYGRTLESFGDFFKELKEKIGMKFIVFIHNASYEYHYLRGLFGDENIDAFYTEPRKPLSFRVDTCEFRCTYRLTNSSLAQWGHKIGLEKLDTLDYHTLYTPLSELPADALNYAERDVQIMYRGLKDYIEEYGNVWNIPLTQTGRPRRDIKRLYQRNINHHMRITNAQPKDHNEYKILRRTLAGGVCMAGVENAGVILENVGSFDRASAYPFQTTTKEFPNSRFRETFAEVDTTNYCYIFHARFYNIKAITSICCISSSKMFNRNGHGEFNNGKLINFQGSFDIFMTEVDFASYKMFYNINESNVEFVHKYVATKAYLEKDYVNYILSLYVKKTTLKNVEGSESEYMRSKEVLNSAGFGMSVTSLVFDDTELVNGVFEVNTKTDAQVDAELEKLRKNIWKNSYCFSMGVWITSFQRNELLSVISEISKIDPSDYCYSDTDSVKLKNARKYKKMFDKINDGIRKNIEEVCEHREIDISLFEPADVNGDRHLLGIWEEEKPYDKAVFLGAKRYCYVQHDETNIVVAGVPKIAGKHIDINEFKDGFIFDQKDMEYKKNILTYLDGDNPVVTLKKGQPDEYTVKQPYSICMYPIGYDMSLTKEYSNLIDLYKNRKGQII